MNSDFSNAFNFDDAVQHQVDPRTGSYPVSLSLGDIISHDFYGASFSLKLHHSPFDLDDHGFGKSWSISTLTYYDKKNKKLYTSEGKNYEFDGKKLLKHYCIDDFKIEADEKNSTIDLVYRSGIRERFSTKYDINYMTTLFSPEGKKLLFEYIGPLLSRVVDSFSSRYITINYTDPSSITIQHKRGDTTYLTYQCRKKDGLLDFVSLPNTTHYGTHIFYERLKGKDKKNDAAILITGLKMATGYREIVTYATGDKGHKLPPGHPLLKNLETFPYVSDITYRNGQNQEDTVKKFNFSQASNFLGYFGTRRWDPTYGDSVYSLPENYEYSSVETINGKMSIEREYNKFHLLIAESQYPDSTLTTSSLLSKTINSYYGDTATPIDRLPRNFMFLKAVNKSFFKENLKKKLTIYGFYSYDEDGNLLESSNGKTKFTHEYLPAEEDPLGFVRLLKKTTKSPHIIATPPPVVKNFTYINLKYPSNSGLEGTFPAIATEHSEDFTKEFTYESSDERTFGYLKQTVTRKNNFNNNNNALPNSNITDTETKNIYLKGASIVEEITNTGFDNLVTKKTKVRSLFSGLELENKYSSGKTTQYSYDELNRVCLIRQSVDDNTFISQSISYVFDEVDNKIRIATSEKDVIDVLSYNSKGNLIEVVRNGLQIEKNSYNDSNLIQEKNVYDYNSTGALLYSAKHSYTYDLQGRQRSVTQTIPGTSTTTVFKETFYDDVELFSYERIPGNMAYKKQFFSTTGDIVKTEYYDGQDTLIHKELYAYDAYSRLTKFISGDLTKNYTYDPYDRTTSISTNTPGINSSTTYTYALFTAEDLVESITVDGKTVGVRTFDSLGRITSEELPNFEKTKYEYLDAARLPSVVQQGTNKITYVNNNHIDKPIRVTYGPDEKQDIFTYNEHGKLTKAVGSDFTLDYLYDSSGFLRKQSVTPRNSNLRACYIIYSLSGKTTFMTDYHDNEFSYNYDRYTGLLAEIKNNNIQVTFSYDSINRITSRVVKKLKDSKITIECKYSYDNTLGRLQRKETSVNNTIVYYEEYSYDKFMMINRIERVLPNTDKIIEEVTYDDNGRMSSHLYTKGKDVTTSSYEFDNFNNITSYKQKFPNGLEYNANYTIRDGSPCAIDAVEEDGKRYNLTYDGGGRVTQDMDGFLYQYDPFGRIKKISDNSGILYTSYYYDPLGAQSLQEMSNDTSCYSFYFGGKLLNCITTNEEMTFISDEKEIFYTLQELPDNIVERYLITDYKNTVVAEISGDKVSQRYEFTAYGELLENNT